MSLILTSAPPPLQTTKSTSSATVRRDEDKKNEADSFGEALSRSLKPAEKAVEKTVEKSAAKPVKPDAERRLPGEEKPNPQDLINTLALPFIPLESKVITAPLDSATTAPTIGAGAAKPLTADVQAALASPKLAENVAIDAQAVLQTTGPSEKDSLAIALNAATTATTATTATPASALETGLRDRSSKRDSSVGTSVADTAAEAVDLTLETPQSLIKVSASEKNFDEEPAKANIPSQQAATTDPSGVSSAPSFTLMGAAASGPVAASAPDMPGPTAQRLLNTEVGSSEWGESLGQQLVYMDKGGHQVAELQLNPPGLGPLTVTLSISDQQMQAVFVSAHLSVRAAVEAALPQLRSTLAGSGISLGNTSVNSDSSGSSGSSNSANSQQQAAFANSQSGQSNQPSPKGSRPDMQAALIKTVQASIRANQGIRVDTYA